MIPLRLVANNNPYFVEQSTTPIYTVLQAAQARIYEIDLQIENRSDFEMELPNDKVLKINYKLYMTLIDGKVLNILTDTKSSQACPICGATHQKFINIKDFRCKQFTPKPKTLQYRISQLHSWIRIFECMLHISYRHGIEKWLVPDENRQVFIERKQEMLQRFWETMSLLVDKLKANSSGSTNDGNIARRAFSQPELFARSKNVDQSLIHNFKIILISLTCQQVLDLEKFETFCFDTANLYMTKFPWFPMPAMIHKVS